MPQPNNMLPSMYSAPIASGIDPTPMYGMEGMPMPFGADPRMALAGQFILAPKMREMMGQSGFAPMGLGHDQNVYDTYRKQQYTQMQQKVVMEAAARDRENVFRTFRGMSAMSGIGFGADQRRAANSLADMTTMAAPIMASMNPDLLDQLGGSRGSAAVMAKRMMDAGRYRMDPLSGRMGMSPDSVAKMSGQIYDDLYLRGDPRDMGSVTAGQAGALFGELQNRGMVYGSPGTTRQRAYAAVGELGRGNPGELAAAAKRQGVQVPGDFQKISPEDLDKLTLDESVAGRLRTFDADKIKRSLKSYAGAVSAMRDIFGDMGRPNAPMQELMGGLEAMTMGSMSQMDPARAGQIARQTHNLAKQTGVTMDSAMVLQQHAGARAQQLGLEPIFAVHATQGALAYGGAYRAQGHAAHTAFGAFNADQMTQLDANLRLQASGSNMANQLGTAMRLREQGAFKKGSDAERFTTAVMSGVNEFVDARGKTRSLNMNQNEFMEMMQREGIDDGTVRDMLDQRDTNREQVDRYGITNIVRKEQGVGEMNPLVSLRMGETLNQRLRATGKLTDDQVRAAIDKASPGAAKRIMGMSTEKFARTGERETEIARILEDELKGTDAGGVLAAMSQEDRGKFLRTTASQFYGNMDRFVKQSGYRGMGSFQNVHRSMNQDVMQEAERQQLQARFTGEMQEALSPLGRGTAMSRAIDAMQELRPGDAAGMQNVMMKAFGGVDTKDINMALQKPLAALAEKKKQVEQLMARVGRTTNSEEKTRLMGELDGLMKELKAQTDDAAKMGERFGLYKDGGVTKEDTDRALQSTTAVAKTVMDLSGIRGGFGREVSKEQAEEAAANYGRGKMTAEEAAVVIMARRRHDPAWQATEEEGKKMSEAGGGRVSPDQARAALTAQKQARIGQIKDEDILGEMAGGTIDMTTDGGKAAAKALALHRRGKLALRGSADDVKKVKEEAAKRGENLTDDQAQEMADAEQRAKRLGVTEEEITMYEKGDAAKKVAATGSRYGGINAAIMNRERHRYVVSDTQREEFVERMGLKGKVDLGTDEGKKTVDDMIFKRRAADEKGRFMAFRQSDDGARFREDVDMRSQDVENVMAKLLSSPQTVKRFGMASVDMAEDLKAGQQRLRDLALLHTGGDMARLMMGDVDYDGSIGGTGKAAKVRAEVEDLVQQQTSLIRAVHGTHGAEGRQFQLGQKVESLVTDGNPVLDPVRELMVKRAMIAEGIDPGLSKGGDINAAIAAVPEDKRQALRDRFAFESNRLEDKDLSDEHKQALMASREKIGNQREALGLLGVRLNRGETVTEALARMDKVIADPNADPSLKAGFENAKKQLDRTVKAVAAARRVRPEDEAMVTAHTDLMKRVDDFAAKHGTTPQELAEVLEGKKDVKRLTAFSDAEEAAVGKARAGVEAADHDLQAAEEDVLGMTYKLKEDGLSMADRKAAQDKLAAAKKKVGEAQAARKTAIASVDDVAKGRGVTSDELLFTEKGRLTKEQIVDIAADMTALGKGTPDVMKFLKERGIDKPEELRDYQKMVEAAVERQREALGRESAPAMDLLGEFQEAFGFDKVDRADPKLQPIATKLGGTEQRRLLQQVIGTQASLKSQSADAVGTLADRVKKFGPDSAEGKEAKALLDKMTDPTKKNAGVDTMIAGYRDAMAEADPAKKKAAMEKFQTTFGMTADGLRRFEQAYELQNKLGLTAYGQGRTVSDAQLGKVMDRMQTGGQDFRAPDEKGGAPTQTHVTGELIIKGNVGYLDASTGGSMVHGGPTG